jgi:hypothetical protein
VSEIRRRNPTGARFVTRFLVCARTRFPFHTSSAKKLTLDQTPVITVTGKTFFDVGNSLKDQKSNRRSHLPDYAAWEIHPVMALRVVQAHARVLAINFL